MNKENCALKLVDEIILYYDARSKKHQIYFYCYVVLNSLFFFFCHTFKVDQILTLMAVQLISTF